MNRVVALAAQDGQPASEQANRNPDQTRATLMTSNLRFTVEFENRFTLATPNGGGRLVRATSPEIRDAMRGPCGLYGPVAWAHAFKHAVAKMPAEFVGLPETVQAFRVQ